MRGAARAVGCFALIYVLGSALAGVQLMPALELFSVSSRRGQLSYAWVRQYSFVPEGLLSFLVPDIFGNDVGVRFWGRWNLWETSPYVGVVAIGLAFIALLRGRRGRAFLPGCIALICLLMAMAGDAVFFGLIPGFDLFRAQARWLCPVSLFIGLLAGLGADGIAASAAERRAPVEPEKHRARQRARDVDPGLPGGAADPGRRSAVFGRRVRPGGVDAVHGRHAEGRAQRARVPSRLDAVGGVQAGRDARRRPEHPARGPLPRRAGEPGPARAAPRVKSAWVAAALLLLVAIDAWTFGQRYLVTFDPQKDGLSPGAVEFLAKTVRSRSVSGAAAAATLPPCEGMTHRFACIEGVQPNVPARFRDVFWSLQGEDIYQLAMDRKFTSYFIYNPEPALLMLNLRYVVAYPFLPEDCRSRASARFTRTRRFELTNCPIPGRAPGWSTAMP